MLTKNKKQFSWAKLAHAESKFSSFLPEIQPRMLKKILLGFAVGYLPDPVDFSNKVNKLLAQLKKGELSYEDLFNLSFKTKSSGIINLVNQDRYQDPISMTFFCEPVSDKALHDDKFSHVYEYSFTKRSEFSKQCSITNEPYLYPNAKVKHLPELSDDIFRFVYIFRQLKNNKEEAKEYFTCLANKIFEALDSIYHLPEKKRYRHAQVNEGLKGRFNFPCEKLMLIAKAYPDLRKTIYSRLENPLSLSREMSPQNALKLVKKSYSVRKISDTIQAKFINHLLMSQESIDSSNKLPIANTLIEENIRDLWSIIFLSKVTKPALSVGLKVELSFEFTEQSLYQPYLKLSRTSSMKIEKPKTYMQQVVAEILTGFEIKEKTKEKVIHKENDSPELTKSPTSKFLDYKFSPKSSKVFSLNKKTTLNPVKSKANPPKPSVSHLRLNWSMLGFLSLSVSLGLVVFFATMWCSPIGLINFIAPMGLSAMQKVALDIILGGSLGCALGVFTFMKLNKRFAGKQLPTVKSLTGLGGQIKGKIDARNLNKHIKSPLNVMSTKISSNPLSTLSKRESVAKVSFGKNEHKKHKTYSR